MLKIVSLKSYYENPDIVTILLMRAQKDDYFQEKEHRAHLINCFCVFCSFVDNPRAAAFC